MLEVALQPLLGDRFAPARFADVGPAEYFSPEGRTNLIVDSVPSMANRLEAVVWDEAADRYLPPLEELPFLALEHPEHGLVDSVTQPARAGSPYLYPLLVKTFEKAVGKLKGQKARNALAGALLRLDPNSVLHGVFMPSFRAAPGLPRLLTASIDARDVSAVDSKGVRFDPLDESGSAEEGKGAILYGRREYVSNQITAYFHLDLYRLRRYGFSNPAQQMLTDLAVLKVLRFLRDGLHLRAGCDLKVVGTSEPLPDLPALEERLRGSIRHLRETGELGERTVLKM